MNQESVKKILGNKIKALREIHQAGLRNDIRFHDLRHTYASYLAMNHATPKELQDLMRHVSIVSTMGYIELSRDHLSKISNGLDFGIKY